MVSDSSQHRDIVLAEIKVLVPDVSRRPDRGSIGGPAPQHPTTGHFGDFKGPPLDIGNQILVSLGVGKTWGCSGKLKEIL